jgi:F420H(2)-dependent quinone reductase
MDASRPPVEERIPPARLLRIVNPILRGLLRSPLHRLLSKQVVLLTVTGRKSGRAYTIPVGRHLEGGTLTVAARGTWRVNLRGGAQVLVTIDGREHSAHAELQEDPDQVAAAYLDLLRRNGTRGARQLGLKLNVDRLPTIEELKPAVAGRGFARISLDD